MTSALARHRLFSYVPRMRLEHWAIGSIYLFAFISPQSISLGQAAQAVMLIVAIVFAVQRWEGVRTSLLFWFGVAYVAYILGRGVIAAYWELPPEMAAEHMDVASSWARGLVFPIVLCGLVLVATGNWRRHAFGVLIAMVAGMLIFYTAPEFDLQRVERALSNPTSRFEFGFGLGRSGIFVGAAVLAALIFAPLIIRRIPAPGQRLTAWAGFALRSLIAIALIAMTVAALYATGTRGGWVATAAALLVVAVVAFWAFREHLLRPAPLAVGALALMAVVGLTAAKWDPLTERMAMSVDRVSGQIAEMEHFSDVDHLEGGQSRRVAYFVFAVERFMERPVFGFGPGDPYYLLEERPRSPVLADSSGHFHNGHLEILVRLGVVGYLLIAAFMVCLAYEGLRRVGRRDAPLSDRLLALFGVAFLVAYVVFVLQTHQLDRFKMVTFYSPILGALVAGELARRLGETVGTPIRKPR